jgi:integrase
MTDKTRRRRKPGEGSVRPYETARGERWLIVYRAPDPATGVRRQKLIRGFPNERAALRALRAALTKVDAGQHVEPSKQRLDSYLVTWLDGLRVAESTRASYAKNCRLHISPYLGSVPMSNLTAPQITATYRTLERSGRADETGGLSPRTVRYIHTILRRALADAVRRGQVVTNPADGASPPSARQASAPEMRTWTGEQLAAFLTWCRADVADGRRAGRAELAVAWELLAMTGMRRGEALALRWADVDFTGARISVRRSVGVVRVKGTGEFLDEGLTKTGSARVVDVDERTLSSLKAHRAQLATVSLLLARDDALDGME